MAEICSIQKSQAPRTEFECIGIVYSFEADILLKPLLPTSDIDISFLKSLCFNRINVSGDILESLLSRCRLLERLDIRCSLTLVRLKVIGLCCKLQQLIINKCIKLKEVEIDAPTLSYFECEWYHDYFSNLRFKSVPVLHEVKVVQCTSDSLLPHISGFARQLYKFNLSLLRLEHLQQSWPTFSNLKHLCLPIDNFHFVEYDEEFELIALTNILEVCPLLSEFKLEISWGFFPNIEALKLNEPGEWAESYDDHDDNIENEGRNNREVETVLDSVRRKCHPNLKVLHVAGFNGCHADVNLILYMADYATNLDTITCDSTRCGYEPPKPAEIEESKNRASKLIKILPPTIRVQVI